MKNLEYLQTLRKIRMYQNDKSETVIVEITREGREMARKARKKVLDTFKWVNLHVCNRLLRGGCTHL